MLGAVGLETNSLTYQKSDLNDPVFEGKTLWQHDFLALPYLPYFSNCDGYDSHITISRLLEEHPDCEEVNYFQTVPVTDFGSRHPVGDSCRGIVLHCAYEEEVSEARTNLRWFEAAPGSTLFHIVSYLHDLFSYSKRILADVNF